MVEHIGVQSGRAYMCTVVKHLDVQNAQTYRCTVHKHIGVRTEAVSAQVISGSNTRPNNVL